MYKIFTCNLAADKHKYFVNRFECLEHILRIISISYFTIDYLYLTLREKSDSIYFEQRKFVLVSQPKRIFVCNKENYIWFKCLLLYFKDPLLTVKTLFSDLNKIFLNVNDFSLRL